MWIFFRAPCPTPDGKLAHWRTRAGGRAFFERWQIDAEPAEVSVPLEGDVGLVPLGGDEPA